MIVTVLVTLLATIAALALLLVVFGLGVIAGTQATLKKVQAAAKAFEAGAKLR